MTFDEKLIDFFKRHNLYDKEMFGYIFEHSDQVDYYDPAENFTIGCPPKTNKYTNKIEGLRLCYPYIVNEQTRLVAVHEISHAIYWYKRMGKKYNKIEEELFPMIVERLYLEENRTQSLEVFEDKLDGLITPTAPDRYKFALANREKFEDRELTDTRVFDKKSRKLLRKWKRENK